MFLILLLAPNNCQTRHALAPVIAANCLQVTAPLRSSLLPIMITIFVWLALITRLMLNLVMRIINLNSTPWTVVLSDLIRNYVWRLRFLMDRYEMQLGLQLIVDCR